MEVLSRETFQYRKRLRKHNQVSGEGCQRLTTVPDSHDPQHTFDRVTLVDCGDPFALEAEPKRTLPMMSHNAWVSSVVVTELTEGWLR